MKKTLLTFAAASLAVGAFGQGTIIFENDLGTGYITQLTSNGTKVAAGSYSVALLWFNGTSFQSVATYAVASGSAGSGPGFFHDSTTVTVPTFAATGSFEVQGWSGNFANYAAAVASGVPGQLVGQTASFTSPEGNTLPPPNAVPPAALSGAGGGWDGNMMGKKGGKERK